MRRSIPSKQDTSTLMGTIMQAARYSNPFILIVLIPLFLIYLVYVMPIVLIWMALKVVAKSIIRWSRLAGHLMNGHGVSVTRSNSLDARLRASRDASDQAIAAMRKRKMANLREKLQNGTYGK